MKEHVFKPSRIVDGKRVRNRLYVGRYTLEKGETPCRVSLNTPDKAVALKRLREIVVEKQREREGILAPQPVREAASAGLENLLAQYEGELKGVGRKDKHVHDTTTRLRRILKDTGWQRLGDIRADQFVAWRSTLTVSAKTKKEYQVSLNAFLNWLIKTDRLLVNPLAKLDTVETRGKQVRECRAFRDDELRALFGIAGKHKLAYQVLLYTGQRKSEVRALVWGDLHLDGERPYALFREGTTKDKDKRAVPLHPGLVPLLREAKPEGVAPTKQVFWFRWPTYDILRGHLKKAKIKRVDEMGRVLHFHSFRKTWQTMGVRYGVNQRVAQEVLGHSDANLTAKVYTDVPALEMHHEIGKFPWVENSQFAESTSEKGPIQSALIGAPESVPSGPRLSFGVLVSHLADFFQIPDAERVGHVLSSFGSSCYATEMAARAGVEPATK